MALPASTISAGHVSQRVMSNSARSFVAASSQYLSLSHHSDFSFGDTDWSAVIYFKVGSTAQARTLASKWGASYATDNEWIIQTGSDAKAYLYLGDGSGNKNVSIAGVVAGQWHCLVVYHDASADEIGVSLDGSAFVTNTAAFTPTTKTTQVRVGGRSNGSNYMEGEIATMAMWSDLTAKTNVADLMNGGLFRDAAYIDTNYSTNAVALWHLQEDSGGATDVSVNGHDLADNNSVGSAEGVTSSVAWQHDDASSQTLETAATTEFDDTAFSVIFLCELDDTTGVKWGWTKYSASGNNRIWDLTANGNKWWFRVGEDGTSGGRVAATSVTSVTAGAHALIIGEHEDGQKPRCSVNDETPVEGSVAITTIHTASTEVAFGCYINAGTPTGIGFDGAWDYALYVNRRMTAAERTWLYNGGAFRSLTDIYAASVRGTGDGSGIWGDITHGYRGGCLTDLFGSEDLTNNGATDTRTGDVTDRLLTDVSAAGIDYQGSDGCRIWRHEDMSGNDHHPFMDTYAERLVYDYNSGDPIVKNDGVTAGGLACDFNSTYSVGTSLAIRCRRAATTNWQSFFDGSDVTNRQRILSGGPTNQDWRVDGGGSAAFGYSDQNWHTFFATFDSSPYLHRKDGYDISTTSSGANSISGMTLLNAYNFDRGYDGLAYKGWCLVDGAQTGAALHDMEEYAEFGPDGDGALLPRGSRVAVHVEQRVMSNSARSFDSAGSEYLSRAIAADLDPEDEDWYAAGWSYLDTTAEATCFGARDGTLWYGLYYRGSGAGDYRWQCRNASGSSTSVNFGTITNNKWHFLEVGHDATANATFAAADRESDSTGGFADGGFDGPITADFEFGRWGSVGGRYFKGRMQMWVIVKGTKPTTEERDWLHNGGLGRSGEEIKAHATFGGANAHLYCFQEDGGGAVDSVGALDLDDNGTVTSAGGKTNDDAWEFDDGLSQYLSSADTAEMGDSEFAVIALAVRDDTSGSQYLFSKFDTSSNRSWALNTNGSDARFFVSDDGNSVTNLIATDTGAITASQWALMIGEHMDGAKARLTVDGNSTVQSTNACTSIHTATKSVTIGAYAGGSGLFDGAIQYVIYLPRRMTTAERVWLYNDGDYRPLSDIIAAAARGTGHGAAIWADATHAYVGGSPNDLIGSVDMTENGAPTTRAGETTSRLLTDVSAAGIDYQGSDACNVFRIEDVGGNDRHPTQATFTSQPEYDPTGADSGGPCVSGGSNAGWLAVDLDSRSSGAIAAFGALGANGSYLTDGDTQYQRWALSRGASNYNAWGGSSATFGTADGSDHVFYATYNAGSGNHLFRFDNVDSSTSYNGTHTTNGLTLLAQWNGASGHAGTRIVGFARTDVLASAAIDEYEEWAQYGMAGAPAGGAYTLVAAQGALALTGQSASTLADRTIAAAQASLALTGQAASFLYGVTMAADYGSFAHTGQSSGLLAGRALSAAQGSLALTGQSADALAGRLVSAAQGGFSLTGQSASLITGLALSAASGSFGLTGQSASLLADRAISAAQAAFGMTGQACALLAGRLVSADQGAFTLAGQDANIGGGLILLAASGSFATTGQSADLLSARLVGADQGSFTLTGYSITIGNAYTLLAAQGSFAQSGQAAGLRAARTIAPAAGAIALSGQDASPLAGRLLGAGQGALALSGQGVDLFLGKGLVAEAGSYALAGQSAALDRTRNLLAAQGSYALDGQVVDFTLTGPADQYLVEHSVRRYALWDIVKRPA